MVLFNILSSSAYLHIAVLKYVDYRDRMLPGHKTNLKFIADEFIGIIMELETDKKYIYLQIFDGDIVCNKAQKVMKVHWPSLTCFIDVDHINHNILNHIGDIHEITAISKEDKVFCLNLFGNIQ